MLERAKYAAGGVLLAPLLIGRMSLAVLRTGRHLGRFARAFPWVVAYTSSWSAGEFIGYVKGLARKPQ
jgi:hypothetical protein